MPFYFTSTKSARHKVNPKDLFYSRAMKGKSYYSQNLFSGLPNQS